MLKLCVIIFSRNETESLFNTFNRILYLSNLRQFKGVISEVFIVDDGSDIEKKKLVEEFFSKIEDSLFFDLHFVSQAAKGISKTVSDVLSKSKENVNSILPLPGHDMFDTEALCQLIEGSKGGELSIGYRANLWSERPFLKYVAAKILTLLYKIFVFPKLIDAHGLYIIPIEIAKKYINPSGGHEILILPLYMSLKKGIKINQIQLNLNPGHLAESLKLGRSKHTRVSHIISSLKIFVYILKDKFGFKTD